MNTDKCCKNCYRLEWESRKGSEFKWWCKGYYDAEFNAIEESKLLTERLRCQGFVRIRPDKKLTKILKIVKEELENAESLNYAPILMIECFAALKKIKDIITEESE